MTVPATVDKPYEVEIYGAKDAFLKIADEKTFLREITFAIQAIEASPNLQRCAKGTIRNAIQNIAMTGASLNPALQQAFLIPRKGECCLDFSYRGLIKLAIDSGSVLDIDATVVHEKDEFYYEMGLNPVLTHRPCMESNPGELTHVYAVAILLSGIKKFIVLNKTEIGKVKSVSKASSGPWIDWPDEMARKTAVKKLYKLLPQTDKLSHAIMVVNEHEGVDFEERKAELSTAKKLMDRINQKSDNTDTGSGKETKEDSPAEKPLDSPPSEPAIPDTTPKPEEKHYSDKIKSAMSLPELQSIWNEILTDQEVLKNKFRQQALNKLKNAKKTELEGTKAREVDLEALLIALKSAQTVGELETIWNEVEPHLEGETKVKAMRVKDKRKTEIEGR